MKSAEQWIDEYFRIPDSNISLREAIELVQRDALNAAAKVCDELVGMHGGGLCAERIRALIPSTPGREAT